MTLRKERLEEIAELARKATYKPCAMHMTNLLAVCGSEVIEEMARKLLTGMAQEPYGYVHKEVYESEGSCGLSSDHEAHRDSRTHIPLYAAPQLPQPAVISALDMSQLRAHFERWMIEQEKCIVGSSDPYPAGIESRNWRAWKACRAAMLQADNSPVIPDGWVMVPVEPTEAMNKAGWAAINEYDEINPTYRAMLAAAPQQEVK